MFEQGSSSAPSPAVQARPIKRKRAPDPFQHWSRVPLGKAAIALVLVVVVAGALPVLLAGLLPAIFEQIEPAGRAAMLIEKGAGLLFAVAVLVALRELLQVPWGAFGLRIRSWRHEFIWTTITLAMLVGAWILAVGLVYALLALYPALQEDLRQRMEFFELLPIDDLYFAAILMLLVALQEELLFRALLLTVLRGLLGTWTAAIIVSGVIFGALHYFGQGVLAAVQITLLGAAFAISFALSRSLVPVVIGHFLFNFTMILLARLAAELFEDLAPP